jgi:hypothetical protein
MHHTPLPRAETSLLYSHFFLFFIKVKTNEQKNNKEKKRVKHPLQSSNSRSKPPYRKRPPHPMEKNNTHIIDCKSEPKFAQDAWCRPKRAMCFHPHRHRDEKRRLVFLASPP